MQRVLSVLLLAGAVIASDRAVADHSSSSAPGCEPGVSSDGCGDSSSVSPPQIGIGGKTGTDVSEIVVWTRNYHKMLSLLQKTSFIGACKIDLASDTGAPKDYFVLNVKNSLQSTNFDLNPPASTNGMSQAKILPNHVISYIQNDIVGSVDLNLQLNSSETSVLGLSFAKTYPDGTVYERGISCGSLKGS